MATYFVNTAGSNTAPYDTEAKAANALATVAAVPWADGDIVRIKSTHNENIGSTTTFTLPTAGTNGGVKILSVAFDGSGTGALTAGATLTASANAVGFNFTGGYGYMSGVRVR